MSNEDTLRSLGKLIPNIEDAQRDAVHIAVVGVVAGETLRPGTRVRLDPNYAVSEVYEGTAIGVVDPFLRDSVQPGQCFWLYLNPGSITSLRHDWTHPAFAVPVKELSYADKQLLGMEPSLRDWFNSLPISYEVVMDGADQWVHTSKGSKWGGYYLTLGGLLEGEYVPDEFWPYYESLRGVTVPEEHKHSFFSCSC